MANVFYPEAKDAILSGSIDLLNDDIRVVLVDLADYTYNAAHDFLDDVPVAARVSTSPALANKTVSAGVFDADDTTFSAVSGDVSEALIVYKHTGVDGTAQLIAFLDTGVTGLPVTPNGGDINVAWNASGILALTDV